MRRIAEKRGAFSRADLLAIVAVLGVLAFWLGIRYAGERGRITRCAWNLQRLGKAMQSFGDDHGSALPAAGISALATTWDQQLAPYLKPDLAREASAHDQLMSAVKTRFYCPSDPIRRGDNPRSYVMSGHDMKPENWPPGPENTTGVGLWWGQGDPQKILGRETTNLDELLLVKFSWLPDPANTLLLTEYPNTENRMGHVQGIQVQGVRDQGRGMSEEQLQRMHYNRFNYLMADGHVELLTSLQTGGTDGRAGIWTIKKGD